MSWYKTNNNIEDPFRTDPLLLQLLVSEALYFRFMVVFSLSTSTLFVSKNVLFLQTERREVLGTNFNYLLKENHFDIFAPKVPSPQTPFNSIDLSSCVLNAL